MEAAEEAEVGTEGEASEGEEGVVKPIDEPGDPLDSDGAGNKTFNVSGCLGLLEI